MLFLLVSPVILGYMTFHIFVYIFSSVVSIVLVLPLLLLVFYLPLSLCFRRRSRHTSLVSFVIFPSFFLALFVFLFWFPALVYARFQRIASKSANLLDVCILIARRFSVWRVGAKFSHAWLGTQISVAKVSGRFILSNQLLRFRWWLARWVLALVSR